jgi:predicted transposase YdaD
VEVVEKEIPLRKKKEIREIKREVERHEGREVGKQVGRNVGKTVGGGVRVIYQCA